MADFVLHTTGPVQIGTTVVPATDIGSALGSQVKGEQSSGEVFSRFIGIYGQKPTLSFTTHDLAGALTACGPMGVSLATKTLTMFGSKIESGGTISTTGHVSLAAALGMLYPKTLSCAHQGDASLSFEAMLCNAVDATDPFTLVTSASLPTILAASRWTLDSCTLGGVSITQQMNVNIDFGVRCFGEGSDSDIRDKIVAIQSVEPRITVSSSKNGAIFSLLGASGAFSIVLRNRVSGGGFGTSTITLAASDGLAMQDTPFQASGHRPSEVSLVGHIAWDGTNDPITFTHNGGA